MKRRLEALAWMLAYGTAIGWVWAEVYKIGPYFRSLG